MKWTEVACPIHNRAYNFFSELNKKIDYFELWLASFSFKNNTKYIARVTLFKLEKRI